MLKTAHSVWFNDGVEADCFALIVKHNDDDTLNLIYFPASSPVEHADNIPEGTGGRTWHK